MLMPRISIIFLFAAILPLNLLASPAKDLKMAATKGQFAFVLVTDGTINDVSSAKSVIQRAVKEVKNSVMVELNRSDKDNADLVTQYRLSTIPVPMILAISPNGAISGGIPADKATADILIKMVPSPKKAEIIKALSEGNAVFITAYRKNMKSVETVNSACGVACQQMAGKSVQVKVNMDDPAETGFLTEMKVNMASTEPVTLVANAQGQIAGTYMGAVQVSDLVTAATKKAGGCCPKTVSNPNASCAPTKK